MHRQQSYSLGSIANFNEWNSNKYFNFYLVIIQPMPAFTVSVNDYVDLFMPFTVYKTALIRVSYNLI